MDNANRLPTWAPRVPKRLIRRFYETDAKGIYDEELIDELGYALLARCESFITANHARAGELPCPCCSQTVKRDDVLRCQCGWELPWAAYFKTIQHKQLSGAEPVLTQFEDFVKAFPAARTPREKVQLIDRLIHGFHWYLRGRFNLGPTRPVAVNLIQGRVRDVVAFLDEITYTDKSTPGMAEIRAEWDANIDFRHSWWSRPSKAKSRPPV